MDAKQKIQVIHGATIAEELEAMTETKMNSMTEEEFDAWTDSFCGKPLTWDEAKKLDEIMDKFYGNKK